MKTVWIDLTDIELWAGHHGGTQRVVYGIAKHYYLDANSGVRFFAYSPIKNIFYETSFTPIYERVEALKDQTALDMQINKSLKQQIKKKLLHYSPAYIRNNKQLKNNIKLTARKAISTARAMNNTRQKWLQGIKIDNPKSTTSAVNFGPEDAVLILGKPWDNPGIQRLLAEEKSVTNFKIVQVVYDLIISLYPHLHHPSLFKVYTQNMFDAVAISDLLLPISLSSDKDLKKFSRILNLPVPKTSVIRLGDELEIGQVSEKPDNLNLDNGYILCVGTIENRKNHTLLYQAYKLADARGVELPSLIIVGGYGWLADDIKYLITHDPRVIDKIHILHGISDSSLSWLYKNCLFTVFPSLYEGWGLPIAESMAYGKFCISAGISSMPEIAGDLVEYFSPYDANELLSLIEKYAHNKDDLNQKEARIKKEYKPTSWEETYQQVQRQVLDI